MQEAFGNLATQTLVRETPLPEIGPAPITEAEQEDGAGQAPGIEEGAEAEEAAGEPGVEEAEGEAEETEETGEEAGPDEGPEPEAAEAAEAPEPAAEGEEPPVAAEEAAAAPEPTAVPVPGEPARDVGAWSEQVRGAADAIPSPSIGDVSGRAAAIRRSGFRRAEAHRRAADSGRGRGGRAGGGAARRERRREPDPVPAETRALEEASGQRLDEVQHPPEGDATPLGRRPRLGQRPVPHALFRAVLNPVPEVESQLNETNRAKLDRARERLLAPDPQSAPDAREQEAPKIPRERPPVRGRLDPEMRESMADVFAILLAEPQQTALDILSDARKKAYANAVLETETPQLGVDTLTEGLAQELRTRLEQVGTQVGVTRQDLDARLEVRREILRRQREAAASQSTEVANEVLAEIRGEGQRRLDRNAGRRRQTEQNADQVRDAAQSNTRQSNIERQRDRLIEATTTHVAREVNNYTSLLNQRKVYIEIAKRDHASAFRFARQQDELRIRRTSGDTIEGRRKEDAAEAIRRWETAQTNRVNAYFGRVIRSSETGYGRHQTQVRDAGQNKREAVRRWADARLGTTRTAEEVARQRDLDLAAQAEAVETDRANLENQQTGLQIGGDLQFIQRLRAGTQEGQNREAILQNVRMNSSRRSIADAFFQAGGGEEGALQALATGIRTQLMNERTDQLKTRLESMFLEQFRGDYEKLNAVGMAQNSEFHGGDLAQRIRDAVDRVGTEEAWIYTALRGRTQVQIAAIEAYYRRHYNTTVEADLRSDLSGREEERAVALLQSDQTRADMIAFRQATHGNYEGRWFDLGGITGLGTDNPTLMQLTRERTPEQLREISEAYTREFRGDDLRTTIQGELEIDRNRQRFDALWVGDNDLADAIELRDLLPTPEQVNDPEHPRYPDRERIQALYLRVRNEVKAQAAREGWDTEQMELEITRRVRRIRESFNQRFGDDYHAEGEDALSAAFDTGFRFSPGRRNLAEGLANNDHAQVDAARVRIEDEGVYASDSELNRILYEQYSRALETTRRDEMPVRRILMAQQLQEAEQAARDRGQPMTGTQYRDLQRRLQREMDRTLEQAARGQARGNMQALRQQYERDYPGSTLFDVIDRGTSLYGNAEAMARLRGGGYLRPEMEVYFAVHGAGTNEEALKRALRGRTEREIAEIAAEYRAMTGRDMAADIRSDVSGRTEWEMDNLLRGEAETVQDEIDRLRQRVADEMRVGAVGSVAAARQQQLMLHRLRELERRAQRLDRPIDSAQERDNLIRSFDSATRDVDLAIKDHRRELDNLVDRVSTAIAIAVAIVVTVVLSVVTMGAAAAVLLAVAASVFATAATMATKQLVLGEAYGWEDVATDVTVGLVDAAVSAMTAGLGGKLIGVGIGQGLKHASRVAARRGARAWIARKLTTSVAGRAINPELGLLARAVPQSKLLTDLAKQGGARRFLAVALAEGAEDLVANVPTAFAQTALDDKVWESGTPLKNLALGTLRQTATGMIAGAGFRGVQGIGGRAWGGVRNFFRTVDSPEAVLRLDWDQFRSQYPDATHADFAQLQNAARRVQETRIHEEAGGRPDSEAADAEVRPVDEDVDVESRPVREAPEAAAVREEGEAPLLTEADMIAALPVRLRDQVPVRVDPKLEGRTVRVEYVRSKKTGAITEVRIAAGREAQPIDIMMHVPTVQAMRRYTGIGGRVRTLVHQMRAWVRRNTVPPVGSRAWEAQLELEKLPLIIEQRLDLLRQGGLSAKSRNSILADINNLRAQLDGYQRTLDVMDRSPGEGYVAAGGARRKPPHNDTQVVKRGKHEDVPRYPVDNSSLSDPATQVHQIGPSWSEKGRRYRLVEVLDSSGKVKQVREEIQRIDDNGKEVDRWVQRGSETKKTGEIGEEAYNLQAVKEAGDNEIVIDPDLLQNKSGQGFDGVTVRFDDDGAKIIIKEVKNYPSRQVPFDDITAVNTNLLKNLDDLDHLLQPGNASRLGMTPEQVQVARKALTDQRLEIELVLGPTTKLADNVGKSRQSRLVLNRLKRAVRRKMGKTIPIRRSRIDPKYMKRATASIKKRDFVGQTPAFHELARGPGNNLTVKSRQQAELAVLALHNGLAEGSLARGKPPEFFVDQAGNIFVSLSPARPRNNTQVRAMARELFDVLRDTASKPPGAGPRDTRILLDTSNLSKSQLRDLRKYLRELAESSPPTAILDRLLSVDPRTTEVHPILSQSESTGGAG